MKRIYLVFFFSLFVLSISAQTPKREMRATWLATVWQIDWPGNVVSTTGSAIEINSQKNMMIRILDSLASANMNAVCFQVRSRCDAMYQSSYEPWSTDLVATRGMNPGYDPLAFVIQEGHKRGIEVHAWLNPYRFETALNQWSGKPGDYRATNPDWVLTYASGSSILDPGHPGVVKRIQSIVAEIVNNYDVDGILFDDYFYAYGGTPASLDANTQALYKPANMDLGDWRRSNVNKMVKAVYDTIQQIKPYVRFGVSPFGIWTTNQTVAAKQGIELPSGISGSDMYASIYCDPVAWLNEGSVDYISPQLYWATGGPQDYGTLSPWWSALSNRFGKHFYSSQDLAGLATSNYAPQARAAGVSGFVSPQGEAVNINAMTSIEGRLIGSNIMRASASNFTQEEIGKQITINRTADENGAPGSIFFSTKQLYLTKGFINYLKKFFYSSKSLLPAIDWKQRTNYGMVSNIAVTGNVLSWTSAFSNVRYAVYAIPNDKAGAVGNFTNAQYLSGVSYSTSYTLPKNVSASTHTFAVAVLDRYGNESAPRVMGQQEATPAVVALTAPANGANLIKPFEFSWTADGSVELYYLEIAKDNAFTQLICSRELTGNTFSTTNLDVLEVGRTYYWRVRTRKANAQDGISEVRTVTAQDFKIIQPLTGVTNISLTPTITWTDLGASSSYFVEVATTNLFGSGSVIYSTTVNGKSSFTIPAKTLTGLTSYYIRVTVNGILLRSEVVSFKTKEAIPAVPVILSPMANSTLTGNKIKVNWTEDVASGYRVELSPVSTFPARNVKISTVGAYVSETEFTDLSAGDYYIRVHAKYSEGLTTAWSETRKVTLIAGNTAVDQILEDNMRCKLLRINENELSIQLNSTITTAMTASVMSVNGMELQRICTNKSIVPGDNDIRVFTSGLPKGVYLVHLKTLNGQLVLKFIH